MFYIHQNTCISAQQTFADANIDQLVGSVNNKLFAIEPGYDNIPPGVLRRMCKAVRIGIGAALPLLTTNAVDGIIIGTANGGMEDCIKFLNQIIRYEEGMLTPGNFVQSTPNAIAAQVGLLTGNKGYNITHVHRGLAFENAMLDAAMLANENPGKKYLLGAVDEISAFNYNIDNLDGWHKTETLSSLDLYKADSPGSITGEGAAMFIVNNTKKSATAFVKDICTIHTEHEEVVIEYLKRFLEKNYKDGQGPDLFISGENGDNRLTKYYTACEQSMNSNIAIARFKHMSGEFATASVIAVWLACHIIKSQQLAKHLIKRSSATGTFNEILIYNNHKGIQHSFILISKP